MHYLSPLTGPPTLLYTDTAVPRGATAEPALAAVHCWRSTR